MSPLSSSLFDRDARRCLPYDEGREFRDKVSSSIRSAPIQSTMTIHDGRILVGSAAAPPFFKWHI